MGGWVIRGGWGLGWAKGGVLGLVGVGSGVSVNRVGCWGVSGGFEKKRGECESGGVLGGERGG